MSIFTSLQRENSRLKAFKSTVDSGNIDGLDPLVTAWLAAAVAGGGTLAVDSQSICEPLVGAMRGFTGLSKLIYFLPYFGSNLLAGITPLVDTLGVGRPVNHNFVDGDFSQATGLQGNGTNKYLDTGIKPSQLGTGNNGGIGYVENNIDFTGDTTEVMGCYGNSNSSRFTLDIRSGRHFFSWGSPGNLADPLTASSNGNYYGQRSSATSREIFVDGVSVATNTTSDAATGAGDLTIKVVACDEQSDGIKINKGRNACLYLTDGTFTSTEVAQWHSLLNTYLIGPTGR